MQKKFMLLVSMLLVAGLLLTACGPRAGGGEMAAKASAKDLVVDLPALYIDLDTEGNASIGGTPVAQLAAMANGAIPSSFDKAWVNHLTVTNIQHIQINNTANGIMILANGEPIPSLGWDGDALVATAETLGMLGANVGPQIAKILPLVRDLGIGVVIRIPVAQGTALIPLVVQGDQTAAAMAKKAQDEYLKAVGNPPVVRVTLAYGQDGTFSVADISGTDLAALGIKLDTLNMPPGSIAQMQKLGIKKVNLASNSQGIFIGINDKILPHITWDNGEINHVLKLAGQMGLLQQIQGYNEGVQQMIESFLPAVQASDVNLTVTFP
jgi:hypothetical protein